MMWWSTGVSPYLQIIVWSSLAMDVREMVNHMQLMVNAVGGGGGGPGNLFDPLSVHFHTALNMAVRGSHVWRKGNCIQHSGEGGMCDASKTHLLLSNALLHTCSRFHPVPHHTPELCLFLRPPPRWGC